MAVHRHQAVLEAAHQAVVAPAPRRRAVAEAVQVVVLEAEADLGQNRINTSSKPSNVPMT